MLTTRTFSSHSSTVPAQRLAVDFLICALIAAPFVGGVAELAELNERVPLEKRLLDIQNAPHQKRQALADELLTDVRERGYPPADQNSVCLLYSGKVNSSIFVAGDFNGWDPARDSMRVLSGTDLFYRCYEFPQNARLDYKFVIDGRWVLDPLNPRTMMGGFGPNSELVMPLYEPSTEIEYVADIPHGTVEQLAPMENSPRRTIQVYLPPNYSRSERYPCLYVQDGGEYLRFAKLQNVADNLLAAGKIRPPVIILIDPINRNVEYSMDESYASFVTERLVPHVDTLYSTIDSASDRCIMGASLGGLISLYIAFENPELFGNCAAQSAPFEYGEGSLFSLIENQVARPVKVYIDCGAFETRESGHGLLEQNRVARSLLRSKAYEFSYEEYPEGHSWGNWRARLDEILTYFFPERGEGR